METTHRVTFGASQQMDFMFDGSVDLVVTSPPYPMIEMWDEIMSAQNPAISDALTANPAEAFELMHAELDKVWRECFRLLRDGGLMCVNIGDATRTVNKEFRLFNNHSRIINSCLNIGFVNLPSVIWRKQTNAPNKFMGSGMLPCGAYVTLEHEWILVFRKGGKRNFSSEKEKSTRRRSAFFWEERNKWFSDLWDVKGVKQKIIDSSSRERNASFPLEIPFRLINMYSQVGDIVLDPFYGLGTATVAAMLSGRNSVGCEIDRGLAKSIIENLNSVKVSDLNNLTSLRFNQHLDFVRQRIADGKEVKYFNSYLDCQVMTAQEVDMRLWRMKSKTQKPAQDDICFVCEYDDGDRFALGSQSIQESLF